MIPVIYIEARHTKRVGPQDRFKMHMTSTNREGYTILLHTRVIDRFRCYVCHKKLSSQPSRQHIFAIEKSLFYKLTEYIAQHDAHDMSNMLAHALFIDAEDMFSHVAIHTTPCMEKFIKILNNISE